MMSFGKFFAFFTSRHENEVNTNIGKLQKLSSRFSFALGPRIAHCCGIVGYRGDSECRDILLHSIDMIRHRGYDSCGICTRSPSGKLEITKVSSYKNPANCFELLRARMGMNHIGTGLGIAHTRWATMGKASDENAHPHADSKRRIALVHNGTVTNTRDIFDRLHTRLRNEGICLDDQYEGDLICPVSDSEAIAHLIGYEYDCCADVLESFRRVVSQLQGSWAICMISSQHPNSLFIARHGCPLLVAKSPNQNGIYIASESCVFMNDADEFIPLSDGDLFELTPQVVDELFSTRKTIPVNKRNYTVSPAPYPFWFMKEIAEEPLVARIVLQNLNFREAPAPVRVLQQKLLHLEDITQEQSDHHFEYELKMLALLDSAKVDVRLSGNSGGTVDVDTLEKVGQTRRLLFVACGSSRHAALYVAKVLQQYKFFDMVEVDDASDLSLYRYQQPCTVAFISQSGETLDTINACTTLESICPEILKVAITNSINSTLDRSCDFAIHLKVGIEFSVPSTKSFMSQLVTALLLGAHIITRQNQNGEYDAVLNDMKASLIPFGEALHGMLKYDELYSKIGVKLYTRPHMYILGKGPGFAIALEAALKLKEVSYIYAEGVGSAQMKHGCLATIDEVEETPVVVIVLSDDYEASANAAKQLKARGAYVICITDDPSLIRTTADVVIKVPRCGVLTAAVAIVPFQVVAYKIALMKNINPDTPRGLAKAVTVV